MSSSHWLRAVVLAAAATCSTWGGDPPRIEFTRMVAHWDSYGDPDYVDFIREAKPEVAQVGFYGAHFWSLGHTDQYSGYPAHFPVKGLAPLGDWFEDLNRKLHANGTKVVGHFNIEFLIGDPDGPSGPTGFFKFYRELWDEKLLGPRPVADPMELLERNADGTPIKNRTYAIGGMNEYWACLRNPAWRSVLKAWVRHGLKRGVDGFIVNYFYRHNCLCKHCLASFRGYLKSRFTSEELKSRFGIDDPDRHVFKEIVSWHPPSETNPLRLEMLRFSQISNKEAFDEVFIKYGRSLKPDLIVGQWNHLGNLSQIEGDERCMLPGDLWGKDESYLWYSTGGAAFYTDLKKRFLGDATLQARFIRGMFDDKPYTLGKYESTRTRAAIAELAANGGAPMGFYTRFKDPDARREITRYYDFLARNDEIYRADRPHAEAVLIFPRSEVHKGNIGAVEAFRRLGQSLLERHVLFDVLPDDSAFGKRVANYPSVVRHTDDPSRLETAGQSRFEAPFTVRVSANVPGGRNEVDLHFVNYNRVEPPPASDGTPSPGGGIKDEKPIPVSGIKANFVLPKGKSAKSARFITPERRDPIPVPFTTDREGRIVFTVPEFLVYGVVGIELEDRPRDGATRESGR